MGTSQQAMNCAPVAVSLPMLPVSIESLRASVGTRPEGFRFSRHVCNVSAELADRTIVVSGEDEIHETAQAKAISELIERTVVIVHGDRFGARTSNGWAAHPDEDKARQGAIYELMERDAVLSHWYATRPFLVLSDLPPKIERWKRDELAKSELPLLTILLTTDGIGPSATCLLRNESGFGVCGHATRASLCESIDAAIAEACRSAHAFVRRDLWRETQMLASANALVTEPDAYSLYYAYVEPFPEWMIGQTVSIDAAEAAWSARISAAGKANEFSYKLVTRTPLFVGFASHPNAFDLTWERTNAHRVARSSAARRIGLSINKVNMKPHIVS